MQHGSTGRKRVLFIGKLTLGAALLAVLLVAGGAWRDVLGQLQQARLVYLGPFLAMTFVLIGISCAKWQLFLSERGVEIGLVRLFGIYLIGRFFNNFLPSMFGGDLVRAYVLGRQIGSQTQSMASVLLERLTGLVALVSLAIGAWLLQPSLRAEPIVTASIAAIGGGCAALLVLLWRPALATWFLHPVSRFSAARKLAPKLEQLHENIVFFRDRPRLVAKAMGYSYAFHFLTAVNVYLACLLLDVPSTLGQLVVVTPIILAISSLPLTPNSLGVWEWAFTVYLATTGAAAEQGLAVALVLRAKTLLTSVVGGLLFLIEGAPAGASEGSADGP
jgi:hypothetical protein